MCPPNSHTDYTYDAAGNMTYKDLDDLTETNADEAWDYSYNSENRQIEVEKNTSTVGLYTYNALGNRVKKVAGTVTEELYFDGADCVGELYSVTGESPVTVNYVTPSLDENITMTRGSSDYYYTQDGLGSVREIIDSSQATQNTYDYEAFGSAYNWSENVVNRYTFTGREWDAESGSQYSRARQYYPGIGRFGGRDPIPSLNLYAYVNNNCALFVDPYGLMLCIKNTAENNDLIDMIERCSGLNCCEQLEDRPPPWCLPGYTEFKCTGENNGLFAQLLKRICLWPELVNFISEKGAEGGVPGDFGRDLISGQTVRPNLLDCSQLYHEMYEQFAWIDTSLIREAFEEIEKDPSELFRQAINHPNPAKLAKDLLDMLEKNNWLDTPIKNQYRTEAGSQGYQQWGILRTRVLIYILKKRKKGETVTEEEYKDIVDEEYEKWIEDLSDQFFSNKGKASNAPRDIGGLSHNAAETAQKKYDLSPQNRR